MISEGLAREKERIWKQMRQRNGDEWMEKHAKFLEAQWVWAQQLGFVEPGPDLPLLTPNDT